MNNSAQSAKRPHILVSNDDGIGAPGILALVEALVDVADVSVIAPDRERSASSHALTMTKPLRIFERRFSVPVRRAVAVDGTPADCVKLGILELLADDRPDLVVSGVNRGANLGVDVYYSGTVAAAMEGLFEGIPAMAFSLSHHDGPEFDFSVVKPWIRRLVPWYLGLHPDPSTLINVNVPAIPAGAIKGLRTTRLGRGRYLNPFDHRRDPRGHPYYWMAGTLEVLDQAPEADLVAVRSGWVSLTPIAVARTDDAQRERLGAILDKAGLCRPAGS